jgi:hypothetical protein
MNKDQLVESYVVEQITKFGHIPTRDDLLRELNVCDSDIKEIDSHYRSLELIWGLTHDQSITFLQKVTESDPKPTDFASLFYLVFRTEMDEAVESVKRGES